jgi:hypothetical protein
MDECVFSIFLRLYDNLTIKTLETILHGKAMMFVRQFEDLIGHCLYFLIASELLLHVV